MKDTYNGWVHEAYHVEIASTFDHTKRYAPIDEHRVDDEDNSIQVDIQWIIEQHMPEYLEFQKPIIIIGV